MPNVPIAFARDVGRRLRGKLGRRAGLAVAVPVMLAAILAFTPSKCSAHNPALLRLKQGECKPGRPLAGVYLPFRLHVEKGCVTVSGTVDCLKREPDGDIHIRLRLDPAYRRLLTPANGAQQCPTQSAVSGPHLVVEIIPQKGHLPFTDNSADRGGFVTPAAPKPGDHVTVTGPYVLDSNALHDLAYRGRNVKNWAEIHPAWNVTVTRHAT